MRDVWSYRCFAWSRDTVLKRRWMTVPWQPEYRIRVLVGDHWRLYVHIRRKGWVWAQWGMGGRSATAVETMPFEWRWTMALVRRTPPSDKAPATPLPAPYAVFGPMSLLAEHLSATQYADKSPRTPGSVRIGQRNGVYEVTVYDHDAGLRLPVCGPTVEAALEQVEVLLGAADAPWVVDDYLTGLAAKRKGKKK